MLRQRLLVAASLALLAGCFNPLIAPDDGTAASTSADGTTTTTTPCNPVLGGTGGAGLVTCGADQICIFATSSGFDATQTGCFPVVSSSTSDGDACSTLDACGPGQACTDQGCQTLCWVGDTCTGAESCQADTSVNLSVGGRGVGYCPAQSSCDLVGRHRARTAARRTATATRNAAPRRARAPSAARARATSTAPPASRAMTQRRHARRTAALEEAIARPAAA